MVADREKARFSTWYEMFPRSASPNPSATARSPTCGPSCPTWPTWGSTSCTCRRSIRSGAPAARARTGPRTPPRGTRAARGPSAPTRGATAVHPELGTLEEFRDLVTAAAARGIDVAIDLAFQASPDHPWVTEHPEWFRHLPDGTIRYAENPPKRYEDIYPLDFETTDWQALWAELLEVVRFWVDQGVKVFRVDNPHTKPFAFWEWMIRLVKADHPEVIFLAEAFTRPAVMQQLAKVGFTQSYTYFTWRNTKWELETYLTELTRTDIADYFRPNFWPNTPDILPRSSRPGGRAAFLSRLVLAATLSANYGIYGPAFELQEHVPRSPGSEEYPHSEKYEIRSWDLARPDSLSEFIARVNKIRRDHGRCSSTTPCSFTPSTTSRSSPTPRPGTLARGDAGRPDATSSWPSSASTTVPCSRVGWSSIWRRSAWIPIGPTSCTISSPGPATSGKGATISSCSTPPGLAAHLFSVEQTAARIAEQLA